MRNSAVFKMLAMLNIGERAGSGLANLKYVRIENLVQITLLTVPLLELDSSNDNMEVINCENGDRGAVKSLQ